MKFETDDDDDEGSFEEEEEEEDDEVSSKCQKRSNMHILFPLQEPEQEEFGK